MEWWIALIIIIGMLFVTFALGMPVAFAFLVVNIVSLIVFIGGEGAFTMLVNNGFDAINKFYLAPIVFFIIMGEVLFRTGVGRIVIDALEGWIGRIPGRLSLLSIITGTILAALSGATMCAAAVLTSNVAPIMKEKNYSTEMTLGPILGGSILANLIPPSTFAVLMGMIGGVSIAKLLIAIIGPGLVLSSASIIYILIRVIRNPSLAPPYPVHLTFREKIKTLPNFLPVLVIIFLVTGVIFFGVATPTEAAAMGAFGCFVLAIAYRKLTWDAIKKTMIGSAQVSIMIFVIIMFASVFSKILAFTGISKGVAAFAIGVKLPPIIMLIGMMVIIIILGCLTEAVSIMLIAVPIFMPMVEIFHWDKVWFSVLLIIGLVIGGLTPPFGMVVFTVKGLMREVPIHEIFSAGMPYLVLAIITMALAIVFPDIALWLPRLMM